MIDRVAPGGLDAASLPDRSRHRFACPVTETADGAALAVPVLVLCGRGPGPCLMLVGGVHGDEADGIAACLDLWDRLDPGAFVGRVVIVPVANPLAFAAGQRRSPVDGLDLNRVCPGRPDGMATERLAAVLAALVRSNADFLFTMHGWYASGTTVPHVEFDLAPGPTQAPSRTACFAAGFERVVAADWPPGLLPKVAVAAGIPAMEAEVGGQGAVSAAGPAFLADRIADLMRHLGMLPAAGAPRPEGRVWRHRVATAPASGVLRCRVEVGDMVEAGAPLAEVFDLHGQRRAVLAAPAPGLVVTRRTFLSVTAGEPIFTLFVAPEDAES